MKKEVFKGVTKFKITMGSLILMGALLNKNQKIEVKKESLKTKKKKERKRERLKEKSKNNYYGRVL